MPKRTKSMGKIWLCSVFKCISRSTSSNPLIQFGVHIFTEFINNIIAICLMTVIFIRFIGDILSTEVVDHVVVVVVIKFMIIMPYGRRPIPFELA